MRKGPQLGLSFLLSLPLGPIWAESQTGLGERIAQQGTPQGVAPCMACHGPEGAGMGPTAYPRIAGLDADYMARQLADFRTGKRSNPIMTPMAMSLSEEEIAAVCGYYAGLPVPAPVAAAPLGASAKTAEDLVRWGDWPGRGLPACAQCHAPDGNGIGSVFPGLAAQQASYIKAQFQAWRSGARANDPLGLMKSVADRLSDEEIDAVAAYYAARPGGAPTPARHAQVPAPAGADVGAKVQIVPVPDHGAPPAGRNTSAAGYFRSPSRDDFPAGPFGEAVRQGEAIFQDTNTHPASAPYVGNDHTCGNCHLDAGRLAASGPLWAAWVAYPAYRSKTKRVDTFTERVQGCFKYSMNAQASAAGGPPAADSDAIVYLTAYSFWLAKGAATGDETLPGRGYSRLTETAQGFDPARGQLVYAAQCAMCHGENGGGVTSAQAGTLFPPLWGAESYNWGAGMHAIDTAAAFIKHNMPLGLAGSLNDQDAWDVAAYVNSHERPQDPRFTGNLQETASRFHDSRFSLYGKAKDSNGALLGEYPAQAPAPTAGH